MDIDDKLEFDILVDNASNQMHEDCINNYFKSSNIKNSFKNKIKSKDNVEKLSYDYLSIINSQLAPTLYKFFNVNEKFYFKDFYYFAVTNFDNLNETEFRFILNYMYPKNFKSEILNYCIDSSKSLTELEFDSFLKKDLDDSFKNIYLKQLITKYALENFNKLNNEQLNSLWSTLDLNVCKYHFLRKSIKYNKEINSILFLKSFSSDKSDELLNYFNFIVTNNWSSNINYFCKNISHIAYSYLKNIDTINSESQLHFERLFLYHNPNKILESHLDTNDLNLVFDKIYNHRFKKESYYDNELSFMNSLGLGLYKFLEVAYYYDPKEITQFLNSSKNNLFKNFSNNNSSLGKRNVLYILLDYVDCIYSNLQKSFTENILIHFQHSILSDKDLVKYIIDQYNPDSFLFQFVMKSSDNNQDEVNCFIYKLMDSLITTNKDHIVFANKINSLKLEHLTDFEQHLKFSISILKNQYQLIDYPQRDYTLNSIEQIISKIILNKKLENKLTYNTNCKDNRIKI